MKTTVSNSVTYRTEVTIEDGPVLTDDYSGNHVLVTEVMRKVVKWESGEVLDRISVKGWKCSASGKVYAQRSFQYVEGEAADAFALEVLSKA